MTYVKKTLKIYIYIYALLLKFYAIHLYLFGLALELGIYIGAAHNLCHTRPCSKHVLVCLASWHILVRVRGIIIVVIHQNFS